MVDPDSGELACRTSGEEQVGDPDGQQPDADRDIDLEERHVDPGEVVGADQGMLVDEQGGAAATPRK